MTSSHPLLRPSSLFVLLSSLALAACGVDAAQPDPSRALDVQASAHHHGDPRASLLAADDHLAARVASEGYAAALVAASAGNAVYLHPGADLLRGRRAIREYLATVPPDASTVLHRASGGASEDGERGYTFGHLNTVDADGKPGFGKYLAAWRRDDDRWSIEAFLLVDTFADPVLPLTDALAAGYHGTPYAEDDDEARAGVFAADRAFSARAVELAPTVGFGPAFGEWGDANATLFGGRSFISGIARVRAYYSVTSAGQELSWAPTRGAVAESGDLAWTAGDAVSRYEDAQGVFVGYSKYLTIWARQPDGSWRWLLDAGNGRPEP